MCVFVESACFVRYIYSKVYYRSVLVLLKATKRSLFNVCRLNAVVSNEPKVWQTRCIGYNVMRQLSCAVKVWLSHTTVLLATVGDSTLKQNWRKIKWDSSQKQETNISSFGKFDVGQTLLILELRFLSKELLCYDNNSIFRNNDSLIRLCSPDVTQRHLTSLLIGPMTTDDATIDLCCTNYDL